MEKLIYIRSIDDSSSSSDDGSDASDENNEEETNNKGNEENVENFNTLLNGLSISQKACESSEQFRHEYVLDFLNQVNNGDSEERNVKLQTICFLLHSLGFSEQEININDLVEILDDDATESENSNRFLKALITSQQQNSKRVKRTKPIVPIHGKKGDNMQHFPSNFRRFLVELC